MCIGGLGFTAGAEAIQYLAHNTKYNYREKVEESGKIEAAEAEDGVEIEVKEVRREDKNLTFVCRFTFNGDITAMQARVEKWAIEEGRNALGEPFFDHTSIYVDGSDILDWGNPDYDYEGPGCIGEHVKFDGQTMEMEIDLVDMKVDADQKVVFHFADFDMGDRVIEGEWDYTYDVKADAYVEELAWHDMYLESKGNIDSIILEQYAITPNGIQFKGSQSNYGHDPFGEREKEGDVEISRHFRILAWDDRGNYYLMYSSPVKHESGYYGMEERIWTIYDGAYATQEGMANRDYTIVWDENAASVTVAVEEVIKRWDTAAKKWLDSDYELVSEPFTIDLTAE